MKSTKTITRAAVAFGVAALAAASAGAAPLTVTSYSMYNGGTGSFNYQDFSYTPCVSSACTTTSAWLSEGVGKLTDGVSPTGNWYDYGEYTPWVGWYAGYPNGTDPTVTFFFGSVDHINSVTVWVDNSLGAGGVGLPSSVAIDGTDYAITPDSSNGAPRGYTFSGLDITGSSVSVQFFQGAEPWVMVGEVSFNGTSGVPEPATWAMMLIGFAGLGFAGYRSLRKSPMALA